MSTAIIRAVERCFVISKDDEEFGSAMLMSAG
jgi:hypothetical protein